MPKAKTTITAIEIGTSAIKLILGEPQGEGNMIVHGYEEVKAQSRVMKGEISHVEALEEPLSKALNKLEEKSGQRIRAVCLAVTGNHIGSVNAQSSVPITSADRTVTDHEMLEVLEHAEAYSLPIDRRSLHRYQRPFLLDRLRPCQDPRGMVTNQLTANIQIIFGNENIIRTSESLVETVLGSPPDELAFSAIADYHGLGLPGACELGVLVIDIGAGVTEYALVKNDTCLLAGQVTVGCDHIANDLSIGLRLPIGRCREMVKRDIRARRSTEDSTAVLQVETSIGHPPRMIRKSAVTSIVEARLSELFEVVREELRSQEMLKHLGDRIVLCGGGALIPEIEELAGAAFTVPVAIGRPAGITGAQSGLDSPRMITAVGLLHYCDYMARLREAHDPSFRQLFGGEVQRLMGLFKRAFRI